MAAQTLIDRLEGVRRTGSGRWIARCPAHDDRDPSLTITELQDCRVLIHCHAGCGAADVMAAVGLSMTDLFPDGPLYHHGKSALRRNESRAYHEIVVEIAMNDRKRGRPLSPEDRRKAAESARWLAAHPITEDVR